MPDRVITCEADLDAWIKFLRAQPLPMTVSKVAGKKRSIAQNGLIHRWYAEIAEQRGDTTTEEQKAECKLQFGVPILRRDNPEWCAEYDELVRPQPYPVKLRLIQLLDWPVTRKMTTKQCAEYQDAVAREYRSQGFTLTDPEARKYEDTA